MFTDDLFGPSEAFKSTEKHGVDTHLFRGFAVESASELLRLIGTIDEQSPFKDMFTPSGLLMSVKTTECGKLGWRASNDVGHYYNKRNPVAQKSWPLMPALFRDLAVEAAQKAGFNLFEPDACIINKYLPGAKLGMHQDRDELDFSQPIVSLSLGLPATFKLGGSERTDPAISVQLNHGDVIVWGGQDRLRYHGVLPIKEGFHPLTAGARYNLTFRVAG
ncbi:DNA oxidative demethylase AlkB [Pseudomonas viridiflava]|uniref:DNA oxidative demethylase AlkB n=1 Tax=Pseudomonas viridiflava TaxID=33069 RepID=UPI0018E5B71F|nr:DNA oxidative demethylase AlkB [Pseudomonas viridiflava]MBI6727331.1 DNA oxidative demethylase AlkB [Pseudomonas viridiflava]